MDVDMRCFCAMIMQLKIVTFKPGYLSDNCCYSVNDKDLLGGKVFGPATFRLVFRMLYSEL